MPVFRTKKEAFEWLKSGKKQIDVRKNKPYNGSIAVYISGRNVLRMQILKKETGKLVEIVHLDNFKSIIPSAQNLDAAVEYLRMLYVDYDGIFTAYYVGPLESQ